MDTALRDRVLGYLHDRHVLTLATTGPEGVWGAAVFYVNDDFTFYFLSSPSSRHSINIATHPQVAVTIQDNIEDWPAIKGVQFEGRATRITGMEQQRALARYGLKFPLVGNLAQAPTEIASAVARMAWYAIVPERVYFIDNSLGLGHRDEVSLRDQA